MFSHKSYRMLKLVILRYFFTPKRVPRSLIAHIFIILLRTVITNRNKKTVTINGVLSGRRNIWCFKTFNNDHISCESGNDLICSVTDKKTKGRDIPKGQVYNIPNREGKAKATVIGAIQHNGDLKLLRQYFTMLY